MSKPGRTRAADYLTRVDAHLAKLADGAAQRAFLDRQILGWEHRYRCFVASQGASERASDPRDPPQAADFLLTIGGLFSRRNATRSKETTIMERNGKDQFNRAIRSLLVAADQRCPAIIGRAHRLYDYCCAPSVPPWATQQALREIKTEAQALFNAVVEAETALREQQPECRLAR